MGPGPALPYRTPPALEGRYCTKCDDHDDGSRPATGGSTKNTATLVEIPAAGFRISAPRVIPMMPATLPYNAAPITRRRTFGAASWTPRGGVLRRAWPPEKDTK